jgi:hypothetical protein
LSKTTVSMDAPVSSASSRRSTMPRRASAPAAASVAAGVARDSAQGHVTISTATAMPSAWPAPVGHHHHAAAAAAAITASRKGPAMRSASLASRGLSTEARSISATMAA